jgi:hypothetical protein
MTGKGVTVADEQATVLPVLPAITRVELVRVQPGDVLVCTVPRYLDDAEFAALRDNMREGFPGIHIAVIEGDATLAVVRKEEVSE